MGKGGLLLFVVFELADHCGGAGLQPGTLGTRGRC